MSRSSFRRKWKLPSPFKKVISVCVGRQPKRKTNNALYGLERKRLRPWKYVTPHRILAVALFYTLTCIVCMSVYYDAAYRNQMQIQRVNRTLAQVQDISRGITTKLNSSNLLSLQQAVQARKNETTNNKIIDWREAITRDIFKHKGQELNIDDYRTLVGNKTIKFHCKKCAIVSSSGQLLGRGAGKEIDKNECVIRMNDAPTKGFEKDVGTRTTARVIGHLNLKRVFAERPDSQIEFFANKSTRAEKIFIHWSYLTNVDKDTVEEYNLGLEFAKNYPHVEFNMFTPQKMKYAEKLFHHETGLTRKQASTWLSTGWYTMLLAIDSCDHINVYGMVYDNYCKEHPNEKVPYHYYDPEFKSECSYYHMSEVRLTSGHLFITEKAVFARWAHIYNIHFVYPKWDPKPYSLSGTLRTPFLQRYRIASNRLFARYPVWKLYFHFAGIFYPLVH